ncbi:MAG TPA: hypothetical protein VGB64_07710 [Actinomycetota bacterium]
MIGKSTALLAAVLALALPLPSSGAESTVSIHEVTIVPPDGILTRCQMTGTGGTKSGRPHTTAGISCTRSMTHLYATTDLHRHTPSQWAGFYDWGYDQCDSCPEIRAEATASCYGTCPPGFSWSGQYGNHTFHLIDFPAGSVVTPPPGANCSTSLTRMTCTAEIPFIV